MCCNLAIEVKCQNSEKDENFDCVSYLLSLEFDWATLKFDWFQLSLWKNLLLKFAEIETWIETNLLDFGEKYIWVKSSPNIEKNGIM